MIGVSITQTQPNGVTTTWATVTDIRWQPQLSADVQIGYFISSSGYTPGDIPVWSQYFSLDITQIDPTEPIPGQIFSQLTASGGPLAGGTLTT